MKRSFDLLFSLPGLIVLAPVFPVLWLIVVIDDGRPGLFRQQRVGRGGRLFTMYKFRTMAVRPDSGGASFDAGSAARVTRVGRFLRRWKLDELPQLWNVLKGDMSLVGPRPEVKPWVDAYPERWARVLTVRPGITDPASIAYRHEEALLAQSPDPERTYREEVLPHKLALYEEYVMTHKLARDVAILWKTLCVTVKR